MRFSKMQCLQRSLVDGRENRRHYQAHMHLLNEFEVSQIGYFKLNSFGSDNNQEESTVHSVANKYSSFGQHKLIY